MCVTVCVCHSAGVGVYVSVFYFMSVLSKVILDPLPPPPHQKKKKEREKQRGGGGGVNGAGRVDSRTLHLCVPQST